MNRRAKYWVQFDGELHFVDGVECFAAQHLESISLKPLMFKAVVNNTFVVFCENKYFKTEEELISSLEACA